MDTGAIISLSIFFALIALVVLGYLYSKYDKVVVLEFQQGLKYGSGKFIKLLPAGRHFVRQGRGHVIIVDMRPFTVSVDGLQVLSRDGIPLGVSVRSEMKVSDPLRAVSSSENYYQSAAAALQSAVRKTLNLSPAARLVSGREELGEKISADVRPRIETLGLGLVSLELTELSAVEEGSRNIGFHHTG